MKSFTKDEMKQIKAGEDFGCGTNISCEGKAAGDACGTKSCVCEPHSGDFNCKFQLFNITVQ
jgi:hypothetical protein